MIDSLGNNALIDLTTVRPPSPESKIPIGLESTIYSSTNNLSRDDLNFRIAL